MHKKKVVVIGGGTGTHTVLSGLKQFQHELALTAVVTMADSGGSTGRLRDEFGYLPVGDVRMALTALAAEESNDESLLRELFLHRFEKGEEGLRGHNVGNLLLVALTDILGSEEAAIMAAAKVLRVEGEVLPVSETSGHLVAEYDDGVLIEGEHEIDEPPEHRTGKRITKLFLKDDVQKNPHLDRTLLEADLIVIGPGDLYTSVLANLVVPGVAESLQAATAPVVFVANLMTKRGQTCNMSAADHVREVERYIGKTVDAVVVNDGMLDEELTARYVAQQEHPVRDDLDAVVWRTLRHDLLAREAVRSKQGDVLRRSLVRHDKDRLAEVIRQEVLSL